MFVSHEKNVSKKTFQKPNILRRKSKTQITKPNIPNVNITPAIKSLVTNIQNVDKTNIFNIEDTNKYEGSQKPTATQSVLRLNQDNSCADNVNKPEETDIDANLNNNITKSSNMIGRNKFIKHEHNPLNIESFINVTTSEQNLPVRKLVTSVSSGRKIAKAKSKWAFDATNSSTDDMVHNYNITQSMDTNIKSELNPNVLCPAITSTSNTLKQSLEVLCTSSPTRAVSVELFSNRAVKFKCDEPNCSKGFWSEEKLIKHKNSHNKQSSVRNQAQIIIECPVKKVHSEGVEEKCPHTFHARRDLLKHLNEDHSPEDAVHKCEVCGRRFFWATGLRAHAHSVCARGGLACAWPGCTRVFRLPCRLREHARAHTGDRPYLCHYPECGWAFRSASKLVRHARRHTDERRHACVSCGRAFLRPEHLREHARRHHPAHARPAHRCAHPGCEQSFTNMSSLYMHMKKVHRKIENEQASQSVTNQSSIGERTTENVYLEEESFNGVEWPSVAEWHAARTHCTWPLAPRLHHRDRDNDEDLTTLVLEEDVQVEGTEGSANNVYTVRSDLFLHGNVLIDDDSQNMVSGEIVESGEEAPPLDTDLCLTDAHPTIDLMQEELMYEDAAVDESSFRVFLMNGDELT